MTLHAHSTTNGHATRPAIPLHPSPFPTSAALALESSSHADLDLAFIRGVTPAVENLVGWEFRGINHPGWASVAGIKKFIKGFFRKPDGRVFGYNTPVVQNVLDGRWFAKPEDTAPRRFGFYTVEPVDATARDNAYLHALLLDYGKGGNKPWDPTRNIRDYIVQVDPANPDLLLGRAYIALGPLRVHTNYFILERHRRGLTDYARR